MKKYKGIFLILSFVICLNFPLNAFSKSLWDSFLQQPDKNALMVLENEIYLRKQKYCQKTIPSQTKQDQLFELIRNGNPMAFRAALQVSECWDGGDLGDFYRSSGSFFELHPYIFLQTILLYQGISDSQLNYFLTSLPLSTVDHYNLQISMVEKRISILKGIKGKEFEEIKNKGFSFLEEERDFLKESKVEYDKKK